MFMSRIRIRNRILQVLYRPKASRNGFSLFSKDILSAFDEIESGIEKNITPLLSDFFD
jgi:hypothetical protein